MGKNRSDIYLIIMEYAWLVIAVTSLLTAGTEAFYHGCNTEFAKFMVLSALAFIMYGFRRYKRKKEQNVCK